MKICSQKREGNQILLEIEEDYSNFTKAVEKALAEVGREIKIPGFRPGKAPREMVERAVNREAVEARAAENLISSLYPSIIDEAKIEPVDFPNVEITAMKKNKPFGFKIKVDVYPEVKLGKYKGLKAEKKTTEVTDDEVQKVLENFQQRLDQAAPGEEKGPTPLDDEFAKKVSRFGTLAELKNEIKQGMLRERQEAAEAEVRNQVISEASKEAKVDIPPGMIEREIDIMLDELRTSLSSSGLTLDDYLKGVKKDEKAMREELRKSAEVRVAGKVVLRQVAEAEKMEISTEEMEAELKSLAAASGKTAKDMEKGLDESARKYIQDYMLRRKALDFMVEKAKIKEEK